MFKKSTNLALSSLCLALLLNACATDHSDRVLSASKDATAFINNEKIVQEYRKESAKKIPHIHIQANGTWVHTLLKRIAKKEHIPIDKSFIPSSEYRIYAKGNYTFNQVLDMIRKQTDINYIVDDGYLKVKNRAFVNQYFPASKGCGAKGAKSFTISLKDAPLSRIFGYFVEKKGYTLQYDLHGYNNINELPPVNFSYRGCSVRDALQRIAKTSNLKIAYKAGKILEIKDYDTLKAHVPSYFKLRYASSSNSLGENARSTGTQLSDSTDANQEFQEILKNFMSVKGKAFMSSRGYLIVEDTPSSIKRLKAILNKEVGSQQNLNLDITIVSVELDDQYKSGVDWQKILNKSLNGGYQIGFGISQPIDGNSFNISHLSSDGTQSVLQLLGTYGKTKIVKKHHIATRSGILSTLKAVEIIPYIEETSQLNGTVSQVQKEAKSVESGIIINIKPNLDGNKVNMNVDIMISEYLGDKEFGDGFKLPMIKTNNIQSPLTVKFGDTTLITGITTSNNSLSYEGIPSLEKAGLFGMLAGKNEDGIKRTEYLVFIKPSRAKR